MFTYFNIVFNNLIKIKDIFSYQRNLRKNYMGYALTDKCLSFLTMGLAVLDLKTCTPMLAYNSQLLVHIN